jgi:hypothetical protein
LQFPRTSIAAAHLLVPEDILAFIFEKLESRELDIKTIPKLRRIYLEWFPILGQTEKFVLFL